MKRIRRRTNILLSAPKLFSPCALNQVGLKLYLDDFRRIIFGYDNEGENVCQCNVRILRSQSYDSAVSMIILPNMIMMVICVCLNGILTMGVLRHCECVAHRLCMNLVMLPCVSFRVR